MLKSRLIPEASFTLVSIRDFMSMILISSELYRARLLNTSPCWIMPLPASADSQDIFMLHDVWSLSQHRSFLLVSWATAGIDERGQGQWCWFRENMARLYEIHCDWVKDSILYWVYHGSPCRILITEPHPIYLQTNGANITKRQVSLVQG